ncbi:MAG: polysaccharide deacetylase family protein [Gracilimonas sp.]|uniref:polysaccharide deacetylase family protein n=1 Tax=Gracilimonas sp. TaxID=1974203 RepID=UPI00199B9FB9|nr:polysaccharide deacetylase family protein [Gracilimonas sp.]MBD3615432.1 polysaccharide deacetylase family protein [Gracilimonas sp.]
MNKTTNPYNSFKTLLGENHSNGVDSYLLDNSKIQGDSSSFGIVKRPKVLMYHRIVDDKSLSKKYDTCLHIDEFHRQLELLDRLNYTPITFEDYRLYLEKKIQLPQKPIFLTFDDGYLDTYKLAYPLLQEYGMKAVIFVLGDRKVKTNIWDLGQAKIAEQAELMNDEQILELHEDGFEIGCHTLSHLDLTQLSSEACFQEIKKPKIILEALLGSRVNSFSYPYGLVNEEIKRKVYRAGYWFACSVFSGPVQFGIDPLEIRRIAIKNNTSVAGFAARLIIPYEYLEWMWWKGISNKN